jgi:hypothetical protein
MVAAITDHLPFVRQLYDALRALPGVRVESPQWGLQLNPGAPHDAQLVLHIGEQLVRLAIESRKTLYPRDVRQILWRLRSADQATPSKGGTPVPVLVAEAISPGAKELLKQEGIGYFDSGGSLYVPASGAYIYVDKPPPKALAKSIGSLFTGVRAQVLHSLLHQPNEWLGVGAVAAQAQVSSATASTVLAQLDQLGFVESRGDGPNKSRRLTEPGPLLDSWVQQVTVKRLTVTRRYFVPLLKADDLQAIARAFGERGAVYAVTAEAAAQRYAPYVSTVSQVRLRVLPSPAAEAAIATLNARAVDEGANLLILDAKAPGDFLFTEESGGAWLANPIQVYLDLQHGEGRSREMADHLRRERIRF